MTYSLSQQWERKYTVDDYIAAIAASGAQGINWVSTYGHNAKELRQRSLDAGLEPSCFTFALATLCSEGGDWRAEAHKGIDDAAALGVQRIMIVPMPPKGVTDLSENRRIWLDVLSELLPVSRQAGIALTIENFQGNGSAFVTSDELLAAQKELPELRFTYDAGNAATGGETAIYGPNLLRDGLEFVHFKDYRRVNAVIDNRTLKGRDGNLYAPACLGEGDLDLQTVVTALKTIGYDGWVDVEYEAFEPPAPEGITRGVKWLDKAAHGFQLVKLGTMG